MAGLQRRPGEAPRVVWSVMLAGIDRCGIPSMSLTDNGFIYTGRLHGESAFEVNLRALGVDINSDTVSSADLRQDRTILADAEEMAPRPPPPDHPRRTQRPARQFRVYNHHRPHRALAEPPRPSIRRHRKARPPTARYRRRCSSAATRRRTWQLFVAPYQVNVGLRWAGHTATSSATATTSPSSAAPAGPRPSPPTPPAATSAATKPPGPTVPANPNRHHECQRCPET